MAWIDDPLAAGILKLIERKPGQFGWYNIEIRTNRAYDDSLPYAVIRGLVEEGYLHAPDGLNGKFDITESGRAFLEAHSRDTERTPGA